MKKLLKSAVVAMFAAAGLVLVSCNQPLSSATDTLVTIDSTSVTAKAYPGVNVVSWEPVAGADGYVLFKYTNNVSEKVTTKNAEDVLTYVDDDIRDGVEYKYIVETKSNSSPSTSRAVYVQNSKSSPAYATAIVPDYSVKSLDLYKYENGKLEENQDTLKELAEYVITADNIKVSKDNGNKLSIQFPEKAYLDYDIYTSIDNQLEKLGTKNWIESASDLENAAETNTTYYGSKTVAAPGVYKIVIVASAKNNYYGTSDEVISTQSVTIEKLSGSGAAIESAYYKDAGQNVRVIFNKFTLSDGSYAPLSYYKVYRSVKGTALYEDVSGTVAELTASSGKLYVEDTVADSSKDYTYTVAVTDGTRIAECDTATVAAYKELNGSGGTIVSAAYIDDGKTIRVVWNKFTMSYGSDVDISCYKVYRADGSGDFKLLDATVTAADSAYDSNYFIDDAITDSSKDYTYKIVVTNGSVSKETSEATVAAHGHWARNVSFLAGTASVEDADGLKNDITWTFGSYAGVEITGVYILEKEIPNTNLTWGSTTAYTPVVADFDKTTNLAEKVTETTDNTSTYYTSSNLWTSKNYTVYTKDHTYNTNVYMLVEVKDVNEETAYKISDAVSISAVNFGTSVGISVNSYDNTLDLGTKSDYTPVLNDVMLNITDYIDDNDTIDNYTYALYKTTGSEKLYSTTSLTWNFDTENWKEVAALTMNLDEVKGKNNYTAVYKEADLADGIYAYKVVKTSKLTGDTYAVWDSVSISVYESSIEYKPSITANWNVMADDDKKGSVEVKFTKYNNHYGSIYNSDYDFTTGSLSKNAIATPETGVTYTLYQRVTTDSLAEVTWNKVDVVVTDKANKNDYTFTNYANYDSTTGLYETKTVTDIVTSIDYTFNLKDYSTANTYYFMVVAEKSNSDVYYSSTAKVAGAQ